MVSAIKDIPKKKNLRWSVNSESGLFTCHWEVNERKFEQTFGSKMPPNNLIELVSALNRTETEPESLLEKIEEQMHKANIDFSDCFKEEMKGLKKLKCCTHGSRNR